MKRDLIIPLSFICGCWLGIFIKVGSDYRDMKTRYANTSRICELRNITQEEYVCVNDDGKDDKHCYEGNVTWIIPESPDILPLIQKWDKGFIPSIGTKRKCWYYDEKISLISSGVPLHNQFMLIIMTIYIGTAIIVLLIIDTMCRDNQKKIHKKE